MLRAREEQLSGWGRYRPAECAVYRPQQWPELAELIGQGDAPTLIPRGLGRSYGDAAVNPEGVIDSTGLDRLLAFDSKTGLLRCEAGVSIDDLIAFFLPRGWFLPVTPGTKFVTIGGAIAADVHGKNHHRDGSFGQFVEEIELLTPDGRGGRCSRNKNTELFRATLGGMGLTGFIRAATLRLARVPSAYVSVEFQRARHLDAALEAFAEADAKHPFSVAWIDCLARRKKLGRSVLMFGRYAEPDELSRRARDAPFTQRKRRRRNVPCNMPRATLNRWTVSLFNRLYYMRQRDRQAVLDFETFFYPLDRLANWNRLYGRRGFVQYQAVLPREHSRAALIEMLERLSRSKQASFLAVLKAFGPAGEGLLSFPMAGHTLALDLPNKGQRLLDLTDALDRIVREHGGRLYLAKDALSSPEMIEAGYPELERFRKIKATIDPAGRFASTQASRLGILKPASKGAIA